MILHQGAPGVPQDEALGLDWLRRGAAAGDQNARNYLTQRGLPLQAPAPPAADAPSVFIVYFGWESEALTPEAVGILDTVVAAYQSRPDRDTVRVLVAGHDDGASDPAAGMGVSQRRANRVRDYLTSRGIPPSAVSAEALGNSSPRVATPDGVREPQNRRVEISFSTGPRP
jgi:outer membrane protein OmpA-like peptidoglycan-associated protein